MGSCDDDSDVFEAIIYLWFYIGIPSGKTIKGVFQAALKGGKLTDLTENNTIYTVTFIGK